MMRRLLLLGAMCCALAPADAARPRRAPRSKPPIVIPTPVPPIVILYLPPPVIPTAAPPKPQALPEPVRELFETAAKANNPSAFAAVAKLARETYPENAQQIDALVAENDARLAEARARAAREHADQLASAAFLDLWKGEVEAGAAWSSGNSNHLGLYASANLNREGLRWRHRLSGRVDYQRTDGEPTTERAIAAWQPQYKFDERLYAFGLAQYEHDRFLGYRSRFSGGAGVGYRLVSTPSAKLDLTAAPTLRFTDFYTEHDKTTVAGRGSVAMRLLLSPTLTLTQEAAVFLEALDSTVTATTGLDTKLIGALKARLSYNVTYEADKPEDRKSTDTLTRATLVYSF